MTATRMRAADSDRDRAVNVLRDHHAEGRLDVTEFIERMERAQSATYLDELPPLFADLPRTPLRTTDGAGGDGRRELRRRAPDVALRLTALALLAAVAIVGLVNGHVFGLLLLAGLVWFMAVRRRFRRARAHYRQVAWDQRFGPDWWPAPEWPMAPTARWSRPDSSDSCSGRPH